MKVRALRTIRTDAGNVKRGTVSPDLSGPVAKSLIDRGLAEAIEDEADAEEKAPKPHVAAKPKPTESAEANAKARKTDAADDPAASDAKGK
ncbi:hypothetical protein [Sphingopyxis macrogoltabida]|uniref:Uncharacterized protein n=2 Tax=Sphingopyxis macrogoltabida TaxID=33050 RepID=A0AAC8Z1X4_SPHMC|nr:hypothetical protein [Sphingopyxis macrogoltabida]ALJ14116.1 hypothetical protein LH19_14680 [Sphingopyxis macrogoltabida]AMU90383.1 hypothetical protein ATM17_15260 [Sphingopyxis macrogoltabida]